MRIGRIIVALLAASAAAPVFAAASWFNSPITTAIVQDNGNAGHAGIVVVVMPSNQLYTPGCQTASFDRFIIDLSRPASKAQYAMLLAANAAGRNVTISLNEACHEGLALLRNIELAN
jgi:hypothetical protein